MSSVVIGSTIAGTISAATGHGYQNHLCWAENDAAWWLFYISSADTTHLKTFRSPDGVTWTAGASMLLASADSHDNNSMSFAITYKNKASTDVFHIGFGISGIRSHHCRATVSGGVITFAADAVVFTGGAGSSVPFPEAVVWAGNDTIYHLGGFDVLAASNVAGAVSTNADAGTSWTSGFNAAVAMDQVTAFDVNASAAFPIASNKCVVFHEDASVAEPTSMKNVVYRTFDGTTVTPAAGSAGTSIFTILGAGVDSNNFGAVRVSDTDVHVVMRTASNTFSHKRFNGTDTTTVSGAAIPNQNSTSGAGIAMATDGTNVWMFIIDSDAANSVRYIKWTSSSNSWDAAWTALDTTTQVRNGIACYPTAINNKVGIVWTQTNGANFDVAFNLLALVNSSNLGAPLFLKAVEFQIKNVPLIVANPLATVPGVGGSPPQSRYRKGYGAIKPISSPDPDFSDSITKGLVGCWLFNEAGGLPLDLASLQRASSRGTTTLWKASPLQTLAMNFTGAATDFVRTPDVVKQRLSNPLTIAAGIYRRGAGQRVGANFGNIYGRTGVAGSVSLVASGNNQLAFRNGTAGIATPVNSLPSGYIGNVAVTQNSTTATIYLNGVQSVQGTTGAGVNTAGASNIGANNTTTGAWDGHISYVYLWNRVLSVAELQAINSNPYHFLFQSPRRTYFNIPADRVTPNVPLYTFSDSSITGNVPLYSLGATVGASSGNLSVPLYTASASSLTGTPPLYTLAADPILFVGAGSGKGPLSATINSPPGLLLGDGMVTTLTYDIVSGARPNPPSGWLFLQSNIPLSNFESTSWYKYATASEPGSYTWTSSGNIVGDVVAFRNVLLPPNPFSKAVNTMTAPSVTLGNRGYALIASYGLNVNTAMSAPAGYTDLGYITQGASQDTSWQIVQGNGATGGVTGGGGSSSSFSQLIGLQQGDTPTSQIPLYTAGSSSASSGAFNVPLYTFSDSSITGTVPLFITNAGGITGNPPLYTFSDSSLTGSAPLYTFSDSSITGNVPLFVSPSISLNANVPLYTFSDSSITGSVPLYTFSDSSITGTVPLFVGSTPSTIQSIPLYAFSDSSITGTVPLFVLPNDNNNANIPLFTSGPSPTVLAAAGGSIPQTRYRFGYGPMQPPSAPSLDRDHPLAVGLQFASILDSNYGLPRDLVTGNKTTNAVPTTSSAAGFAGVGKAYAGAATQDAFTNSGRGTIVGNFSIAVLIYFNTLIGASQTPFGVGSITTDGYSFRLSSSNNNRFFTRSGGTQVIATGNVASKNKVYMLVGTVKGTAMTLYENGIVTAVATAAGTNFNGGTPFKLGTGEDASPFTGIIYYAYLWNRCLSQAEIQWLMNEPYTILQQSPRRTYFSTSTTVTSANNNVPLYTLSASSTSSGVANVPLYTFSDSSITGSVPLYIANAASNNAGIPLFLSPLSSTNSGVPLYINPALTSTSGSPLYTISTSSITGSMPLFTWGASSSNANIPLFTWGNLASSLAVPLYVQGPTFNSSGSPLYTLGLGVQSGNVPLYVQGPLPLVGGIPLYTLGPGAQSFSSNVPLYTAGPTSFNSGTPLYTFSDSSITGNIPLYMAGASQLNNSVPLFLSPLNNTSSGVPLYINPALTSISGAPLYTLSTSSITGSMPLFTWGASASNANVPLFIWGNLANSLSIPLYIQGPTLNNSGVPLYTIGLGIQSGNVPLYVQGPLPFVSGTPLYTLGPGAQALSNSVPLYTAGPTSINSGTPLYAFSDSSATGTTPLYTAGNSNLNNNIPLFMLPALTIASNVPLFVPGASQSNGNTPLYTLSTSSITGTPPLFVGGLISVPTSIPLFMNSTGAVNSLNSNVPLFVSGPTAITNNVPLYLGGAASLNSNIPLYMAGNGLVTANVPLFIPSKDNKNSNVPLFTWGASLLSAAVPLFMGGLVSQPTNVPLFIWGASTLTQSVPLYINGAGLTNANIPLFMSGQSITSQSSNIPLFIGSFDRLTTSVPLFVQGALFKQSNIPLFVYGVASINQGIPLYISTIDFVQAKVVYKLVCYITQKQLSQLQITNRLQSILQIEQRGYGVIQIEPKSSSILSIRKSRKSLFNI